jgi:cytochrome b6-f complex iron-sulfur subunit
MTSDSDRPEDQASPGAATPIGTPNEEPPVTAAGRGVVAQRLGDGGPSQIETAAQEVASGSRPSRAPHLDTDRRAVVTDDEGGARAIVTRAQRRRAKRAEMNRRQFMKASFWGGMGFGLTGALAAFMSFFWPRGVQGFGGKVPVSAALVPNEGDSPARITTGKFWLTNLEAGAGTHGGFGFEGDAGLVALWWKCPHLGCTVPWRETFNFEGVSGWFRCPCHGSTYTRAGVRVFGPAPRPMDTMEITVNADGSLTVDTGVVRKGDQDNPQRTVPYA